MIKRPSPSQRPPAPSPLVQEVVAYLRRWPRALLLFSGGLDSGLLLALGHEALGEGLVAITFAGPHLPPGELAAACHLARRLSRPLLVHPFDPFSLEDFCQNRPSRCYACKRALVAAAWKVAGHFGIPVLWDGTNQDDLLDHRPGLRALREAGVVSPWLELGLGKRQLRALCRELGLPGDRPPQSCLATRFPFFTPLSPEALARVGQAEAWLKNRGFSHVRLRVRGSTCSLELASEEWPAFFTQGRHRPFLALLARLGFQGLKLALPG